MSLDELIADEPFDYRATKNGLVYISYKGRTVTTLRCHESSRFLSKVESGNPRAVQLAMAKATGHYAEGFVNRDVMRPLLPDVFQYVCDFSAIVRHSPPPNRVVQTLLDALVIAHK